MSDHQRPLNARGLCAAPLMGELLAREALMPQLVFCSDATRARETWELVQKSSGAVCDVELKSELYLAEPSVYLGLLTQVPSSTRTVMMVGHNPGISTLVSLLTGKNVDMPTGAIARIDLEISEFTECDLGVTAELVAFHKPRDL